MISNPLSTLSGICIYCLRPRAEAGRSSTLLPVPRAQRSSPEQVLSYSMQELKRPVPKVMRLPSLTSCLDPLRPEPSHVVAQELSGAAIAAIVALKAVGYLVFRGSNSQKDQFRRDPDHPSVRRPLEPSYPPLKPKLFMP